MSLSSAIPENQTAPKKDNQKNDRQISINQNASSGSPSFGLPWLDLNANHLLDAQNFFETLQFVHVVMSFQQSKHRDETSTVCWYGYSPENYSISLKIDAWKMNMSF